MTAFYVLFFFLTLVGVVTSRDMDFLLPFYGMTIDGKKLKKYVWKIDWPKVDESINYMYVGNDHWVEIF